MHADPDTLDVEDLPEPVRRLAFDAACAEVRRYLVARGYATDILLIYELLDATLTERAQEMSGPVTLAN